MLLRNLLFALGALTLIAGVVLAVMWMRLPSAPTQPVADTSPAILMAAADIPGGTLLRPEHMRWQKVEAGAIGPTDLVRGPVSQGSYYGAVARKHISAGERLKDDDFVQTSERTFLAAALTPGMLAVSLTVDDAQSVSGLVQPGDFVDVVLTETKNETNGSPSAVGETVLRKARVVATDQAFSRSAAPSAVDSRLGAGLSKLPKQVTLEMSELDAKRLLVATQLGRVSLALHALQGAPGTPILVIDSPVWGSEISAAHGAAKPANPARSFAGASRQTVQILRGTKLESPKSDVGNE